MAWKKGTIGLVLIVLSSFVHSQSIEFPHGKIKTWRAAHTGLYDCIFRIKNVKGENVILKYKKISQTICDSWTFVTCANNDCFSDLPDTGSFYPVSDGEYAEFKITINAMGYEDSAIIKYILWDSSSTEFIDTLEYYISVALRSTANFMANSKIRIYPNPAKDEVNISANAGSKIALYDGNGQILLSKSMHNNTETLDISHVKPGLYLLTLLNSNGIHSKQLIVE